MRSLLGLLVLAPLAACTPPKPAQLAPKSGTSSRTVAETTQIAIRSLMADGFEISASDVAGGAVVAKRSRAQDDNKPYVTCAFTPNSLGQTNAATTLTVSVSARPSGSVSAVQITNSVRVSFPGSIGTMAAPPSDDHCASTGRAESNVLTA